MPLTNSFLESAVESITASSQNRGIYFAQINKNGQNTVYADDVDLLSGVVFNSGALIRGSITTSGGSASIDLNWSGTIQNTQEDDMVANAVAFLQLDNSFGHHDLIGWADITPFTIPGRETIPDNDTPADGNTDTRYHHMDFDLTFSVTVEEG